MNTFVTDLAHALGFLSRLTLPARHFDGHDGRLSRAVRAFPLAGILIALPSALLAAFLVAVDAPDLLAAALVVGLQVAVTGALHEDGLADTADGLGAGHDRARALDIMKDSRAGVYGVVALTLSLFLRVAAIAALMAALPAAGLILALAAAAAASRAMMVWHWASLIPARPDGVAVAAGMPEDQAAWTALASGTGFALVALWLAAGLLAAALAMVALIAIHWLFTARTDARLGGFTGDTIGASQQLAEIAVLVALALCL